MSPVPNDRDPRVRRDARLALYLALPLAAIGTWFLARGSRPPEPAQFERIEQLQALYDGVDFAAMREVQLLQQYAAVDTSHPEPNELAGAEFLARELAAAGLEPHIERMGERGANLWAFLEGDDPRAVVLAGHIDVEPAREQAGWKYPPFSATIEGPWIFGRGMYDMKSLAIAQLLAITDLARSGVRPKRSVLFLQTSSEESGSETGARWILREHPELVARMGVVLSEGGVVEAMSYDQIKYWGIEFAQKRFADLTFCGSDLERLEDLRLLLLETGKADPFPDVDPSVRTFLRSYATTRGLGSYHALLEQPETTLRNRARYDQLTNFMQSLFRDELVAMPVEAAPEGGFQLRVFVHLSPQSDIQELVDRLLPEWKRFATTWRLEPPVGAATASPLDSPEFAVLRRVTEQEFPGVAIGPYYLPWTRTDARFYRAAGIPTFGYSPFPMTVTETLQIGIANERMQLPAYVRGVDLYRKIVGALVQ